MNKWRVRTPNLPAIVRAASHHPRLAFVGVHDEIYVSFEMDGWRRELRFGDPRVEVGGLVEFMDNNPLVCADVASIPGPGATLALIGILPLVRAGILLERPAALFTAELPVDDLDGFLANEGWAEGATVGYAEQPGLGSVRGAAVMAVVSVHERLEDLDDLFDDAYGRSLYVRCIEDVEWSPEIVRGKPFAAYRLRVTPGEGRSLLTVQVLADIDGKLGASQAIHALNVMCGFEESLGID